MGTELIIIETIIAVIIVIFIINFCYKKLTQHRVNVLSINNNSIREQMVIDDESSISEYEDPEDIVDDVKIDNYIVYNSSTLKELKECPICLEDIIDSNILTFDCLHYFHEDCIKKWWEKNNGDRFCLICNKLSDNVSL